MDDATAAAAYATLIVQVPQDNDHSSAAQPELMIRQALWCERVEELLGVGEGVLVLRVRNGVMTRSYELGARTNR